MPTTTKEATIEKADGTKIHRTVTVEGDEPVKIDQSISIGGDAPQTLASTEAEELPPHEHGDQPLPDWTTLAILAAVTAVAVWGIIETAKTFLAGWREKTKGDRPWDWSGGLRLSAMVLGGCIGTALYGVLGMVGTGWPWGTAIGAGAGALCTLIVAVIKSRLNKLKEK